MPPPPPPTFSLLTVRNKTLRPIILGSKPDNTDPSDGLSPSDAKTLSSGIEVLSDDAENRDHTVDPGEFMYRDWWVVKATKHNVTYLYQ